MADGSAIEWTDATWNPTTGCTKVSPGCAHCYIERTPAFRIKGRRFISGHIPVQLHADRLAQPLRWRKPRRVFVNSLSDLFHADVPDAFIDQVFAAMALAPQHTFQILTKRPDRMRQYVNAASERWGDRRDGIELAMYELGGDDDARTIIGWPLLNVWLGVSVENQHFADERIPLLLQTPAAVRFISAEPLLGPVNLALPLAGCRIRRGRVPTDEIIRPLDWVIVGGESGPGARPCDLAWVAAIVAQCQAVGVPVFVKQLGARPTVYRGTYAITDRKGGNPDEWPAYLRVREYPE